jgi:signal transduction histidine kinase
MLVSLALVLAGGSISAALTFFKARQLQDNILIEIGNLVTRDGLGVFPSRREHNVKDETIVIQELGDRPAPAAMNIPVDIPDGLQTILLGGEEWRVLVLPQASSRKRVAIAQQTELRDNVAWASSLNVMLPILLLLVFMLLLIHLIIRHRLQPLKSLTMLLDRQVATQLKPLPETELAEEIAPFVSSINALLTRTRQAMEKQHRFIADAAHELRTPITALSLLAENVEHAGTQDERQKRQALLRLGLDRLNRLIGQLLDLARLQSDLKSTRQTVSFDCIVQDAIADLYPLAEASQIDVGVTRREPLHVMDRDGGLIQLVRNAIDNAIRYSPAGTKVDVSLFTDNGHAVLCVEDSGKGIPENELQQVLQPFYRIDGTSQIGNGLGLAISHEIAQRLGGTISLSNLPVGGLRFRYSQPMILSEESKPTGV